MPVVPADLHDGGADRMSVRTPTPDIVVAAAALRDRGLAICRVDPGDKRPTYKGWSTHSLEPDDFRPQDLMGVIGGPLSDFGRPGHATVIIDLDTPEAVGMASAYLPATGLMDGRPGKPRSHWYYLVPLDTIPDWGRSQADQGAPAAEAATGHPGPFKKEFDHRETGRRVIDFIGTGGQAVCPPSLHPSGERREWDPFGDPAVVLFPDLWDAVGQLASACGAIIPRVMPSPRPEVLPARKGTPAPDRAAAYLDKLPGAVSGQGGHKATFRAARCLVWGFGLSADDALRLLIERYNPRCQPEWTERELRHKVEDADTLPFGKPRGWLRDARRDPARQQATVSANGRHDAPAPTGDDPGQGEGPAWTDGLGIIQADLMERYRPCFRRGTAIYSETLKRDVKVAEGTFATDRALVTKLLAATDAPKDTNGNADPRRIPKFYRDWVRSAWQEILNSLPEEAETAEVVVSAEEEFRREVAAAMLTLLTFGWKGKDPQRRSVIGWCVAFAKPGNWQSMRDHMFWCRKGSDRGLVEVAIRVEFFGLKEIGRPNLAGLGHRKFADMAEKYGVGLAGDHRAGGKRVVVLTPEFISGLLEAPEGAEDILTE